MERIYIRTLADDELRPPLEAMATIVFDGQTIRWHDVDRQVERLGFEDVYIASSTRGPFGNCKISLKPDSAGASAGLR